MLPDTIWGLLFWGGILLLILIPLCFFLAFLKACDLLPGELLFRALERKTSGAKPSSAELRSRLRTQRLLSDDTKSPKEKCFALNDEIRRVDNSLFVSREWKQELQAQTDTIIRQNHLGFEDLFC